MVDVRYCSFKPINVYMWCFELELALKILSNEFFFGNYAHCSEISQHILAANISKKNSNSIQNTLYGIFVR